LGFISTAKSGCRLKLSGQKLRICGSISPLYNTLWWVVLGINRDSVDTSSTHLTIALWNRQALEGVKYTKTV
jgi:hypothetical protein